MSQVESYKKILESIFKQKVNFTNYDIKNNCIGALSRQGEYNEFTNNFVERLKRINNYFSNSPNYIKEIINTAKQIGQTSGYKWSGAYSELVALDYWIQFKDLTNIKFPARGSVKSFPNSIAKKVGKKEVDLDMSLDLSTIRIYTDVKSLIPTHMELTDQILERLKDRTLRQDYLIGTDNLHDVDYLRTKSDFIHELRNGNLIDKLEESIDQNKKSCDYTLRSGRNLSFKISYAKAGKNTVLTTFREFDPYKLAIDYEYKILDYYTKLLIDEPSLITFVINPWFNQELNIRKDDFLQTFFRSLSRRVFMNLTKDDRDMQLLFPELKGMNLRISDVAKKISGIIFIKDNSIMKSESKINDTYIYLNPNATNKVLTISDFNILNWSPEPEIQRPFIDDFYYDNY